MRFARVAPAVTRAPPGYEGRFDLAGWRLMGKVFRLAPRPASRRPYLVDLGAGRGRDMLYFARRGFRVLGIDIDPTGLDRARRRAFRFGVRIRTRVADLRTVRLDGPFEVVFSTSALNAIPPELRSRRFSHYRAVTSPGGIHAVNAFVGGPRDPPGPDREAEQSSFAPGELASYYRGWEILSSERFALECRFGGPEHRHVWDMLVARSPDRARAIAEPGLRPRSERSGPARRPPGTVPTRVVV